jgi:hypothetical protein
MKKPILFVYVAGPYSKPDPQMNVEKAIDVGELVFAAGFYPFVPHSNHFWEARHPRPYLDWMRFDRAWLTRADALLRMPGESSGADEEIEAALRLSIPVFYSLESLIDAAKENCACDPGAEDVCALHASVQRVA